MLNRIFSVPFVLKTDDTILLGLSYPTKNSCFANAKQLFYFLRRGGVFLHKKLRPEERFRAEFGLTKFLFYFLLRKIIS